MNCSNVVHLILFKCVTLKKSCVIVVLYMELFKCITL